MDLLLMGLVVVVVGWWMRPNRSAGGASDGLGAAPPSAVPSAFPGGPQGLEETVKWIASVDAMARPEAVRAKVRKLMEDLVTVAVPGDFTYFAFWYKLRGGTAATALSDDEARQALEAAGPLLDDDAVAAPAAAAAGADGSSSIASEPGG